MPKHDKQFLPLMFAAIFSFASFLHAQEPLPPPYNQPLLLNDDDVWITVPRMGNTVGEALNGVGIKWNNNDWLIPPAETPLRSVNSIFLSRQRTVHILVGDLKPQDVFTYKASVTDALKKAKIALSEIDLVQPNRATMLKDGDVIKITRVTEVIKTEEEKQSQIEKWRDDPKLLLGVEKVVDEGQPKITALTVKIHSENGLETSRKIIKREVRQDAKPKIVSRGTKVVVVAVESGRASWYDTRPKTTAHKTLPFGTKLRVTNLENGASTLVRVADRGPYVAGRVVDLSTDAFKNLSPLWQGTIPVKVEVLL